jgi:hypothetical protein
LFLGFYCETFFSVIFALVSFSVSLFFVLSIVEVRKCLLKHVIGGKVERNIGRKDEDEVVNSFWMTLRKGEGTGN